ncbi:FAD-dependent oxidoreductase [Acidobacteriota bacterium]
MTINQGNPKNILVVGGGISGISTALEAAEVGYNVILLEREPFLGGRVSRMNQYFPKLCPPYCGLEINFQRLKKNPNVRRYTLAELESVSGKPGDFQVTFNVHPRYINNKCTLCGECEKVCPVERDNDFNYGMNKNKAIFLPHEMAYPQLYAIDAKACTFKECGKCVEACTYKAIDLDMQAEQIEENVAAIIIATGWAPYDAAKIENLGFGKYSNVITNVMMERMAAPNGPTGGKILRPSDSKEVERIAFVQCAGSRDENHLPYCSAVCCSASLKQASYVRERKPEAEKFIFYIDIRTPGRLEDFYQTAQEDEHLHLQKGKVAKVSEDPGTGNLIVEAEDTETGKKAKETVDMVVLATGMVPNTSSLKLTDNCKLDENGFVMSNGNGAGVFAVGCSKQPYDVSSCVQDSTGAALKAIQMVVRENL